jgi:hypothetical protein
MYVQYTSTPKGKVLTKQMVMYNEGKDAADATGSGHSCYSHTAMGLTSDSSERFYASGNERSHSMFNMPMPNATEFYGYPVYPEDRFHFKIELMNMSMDEKVAYVTVTYDYVPGHPKKFVDIKPVWLDAAMCTKSNSEVHPPKESGGFTIDAVPWTSTIDGNILGMAGHLHDGGKHVSIYVDGKKERDSVATYGGTPGSIASKSVMGSSAKVHISGMSTCTAPEVPVKQIRAGQQWLLTADYDYDAHPGMLDHEGKQSDIMGIALVFVRRNSQRKA